MAVDGEGNLVDGDQVLGILALERLARGVLDEGSLVVSVLSNGGLQAAVEAAGGRIVRTPVGDKHILAAMLVSGAGLGGEKSGHVIIREHTTSGDGIVTAIELLRVMTAARAGIAELATAVPLLPQQQRAIRVRHRDQWEADLVLGQAIADAERRLAPHGRVLVRPSGTEPVLRVMVEGPDAATVVASWPTRSRRSQATDYTSQPRRGRDPEPKENPPGACAASSAIPARVKRAPS